MATGANKKRKCKLNVFCYIAQSLTLFEIILSGTSKYIIENLLTSTLMFHHQPLEVLFMF